jgi:hypothetical protein
MSSILLVIHQYTILLELFHVAFGFFIFFVLCSNPMATSLSRWLFLLWPPDAAAFQGYPLLLALLMLLLFQD